MIVFGWTLETIAIILTVFTKSGLVHTQTSSPLNSIADSPTVLTMCYLIEMNITGTVYSYRKAAAALDLAMGYANDYVLPPEFKLQSVFRDVGRTCGRKTHAVAVAMELRDDGINCSVFIGPGCGTTAEILFDVVTVWDIPIIGCPSASLGLSAPASAYNIVSRTSFSYVSIADVLIRFFKIYNYTTPAVFQDQSVSFFQQLGLLMQQTMYRKSANLLYGTKFVAFSSAKDEKSSIEGQLRTASSSARIFILLATADTVREIMSIAEELGMTNGDYVYIAIELYPSDFWGSYTYKRNDSDDSVAQQAYRSSLMLLSLKSINTNGAMEFWRQAAKLSREKYHINFTPTEEVEIDPVAMHFYDAVLLFANTVVSMSAEGLNYSSGVAFTDEVANSSFLSPVSGRVAFDGDSDRLLDYEIRTLNEHTGKYDAVLAFPATSNGVTVLGNVRWLDHEGLPPNTPFCGFRGENPACIPHGVALSTGQTAGVAIAGVLLLCGLSSLFYFGLQRLRDKNQDPFWWRIFEQDVSIHTSHAGGMSTKSMASSIVSGGSALVKAKTDVDSLAASVEVPSDGVKTATVNQVLYSLLDLPEPKQRVSPAVTRDAALVRLMQHNNIQKFIGIAVNDANMCDYVVAELCQKGSLRDLMQNARIQLDWEFKSSLIKDLSNGMVYLHSSPVQSHGFLNDTTCQIDSRFILKVGGYGFDCLRRQDDLEAYHSSQTERDIRILLWRAPELLRRSMPPAGTQKGDVYSYAILLQQIILRTDPFQKEQQQMAFGKKNTVLNTADIVHEVARGLTPPLRPPVPMSACPHVLHEIMELCWEEEPLSRPAFPRIRTMIQGAIKKSGDNIVDHLIKRMEGYAAALEAQVLTKTREFMEERQRSAELLQEILPKVVSDALTKGQTILPESFDSTTVYFGSVVGFKEAVAQTVSPHDTINLLNNLYSLCDDVIGKLDVFKVEVVVDSFLVVSGLPQRNGTLHVEQIATMALQLRKEISTMGVQLTSRDSTNTFKLRVGMHSGPCVASVVGLKLPRYCLFGDTVNTASRMESHGEAGKIHVSDSSKALLNAYDDFVLVERGITKIKGKGDMMTYWLVGRH